MEDLPREAEPPTAVTAPPRRARAPRPRLADRAFAALEVLWVAIGVALLPEWILYGVLGFQGELDQLGSGRLAFLVLLQNALALGASGLFLRLDGRGFAYLGFRGRNAAWEAALGLLLFPPVLLSATMFLGALLALFPGLRSEDINPLLGMIQGRADLVLFVTISILAGGLGEETIRAFILRRFEARLGGVAVGLVVWSSMFGALHLVQGADKAITVGFLGLLLGLLYAWRRNPIAPIVTHAAFDVFMVVVSFVERPG